MFIWQSILKFVKKKRKSYWKFECLYKILVFMVKWVKLIKLAMMDMLLMNILRLI